MRTETPYLQVFCQYVSRTRMDLNVDLKLHFISLLFTIGGRWFVLDFPFLK